ncbi:MAG: cadmium-translocating P-type ATPase [Clostridia bacterium]|nr:cadmium-translocating P-type ATPase [Clostridia bacterium]
MKKVILAIDGMTCSACSNGLEKYLNKQNGIKQATVNLVMNTASIEYDDKQLSLADLDKFVEKAGFKSLGIDTFEKEQKKNSNEKYKLIAISILSILTLYVSMSHMVGLPVIPYLHMIDYPLNYSVCLLILTTIVLILGWKIIKNGVKNLIHKTPNMDTLVTIGVVASYVYSLYGTIMIIRGQTDFVENLYYESAAIVIFFIEIGKFIENKNKNKTKEALQKLMTITPKDAVIIRDGEEITVTIDEIQKGDIVVCKPGEKIAVDGTVVEGVTHIDESFITGESVPVKREEGSKVIAGSINYEGTIKYKAEKIGKESTVSEIVRMVAEATNTKAPIAKIADTISSYFVPSIIALAVLAFIIWIAITKDFAFSMNIFVSILVVACPCSLGLATPLAIVIASGLSSQKGILVKSSEALENAHKVKTIVFDKTGTLTNGTLSISKIYNYSNESEDEILKQVASIEKKSEHPIAWAITNSAIEKNIELEEVTDFKAIAGYGVYAKIKEDEFYIGNRKLMQENKIEIANEKDETNLAENGNSILFVAKNKELLALIGVKDIIRENIKDTIAKLKARNIDIVMLTGDNEKTAKYIADEIGIENVIANVKPKEKAEKIQELKQNGRVLMCGDGINDSVSLVTADIGVSISNGTDIAIDSANVVLMNGNLDKINDLIYISYKTIRNIKQNLFWAFFYNILMIPIAAGLLNAFDILLNPMIAAFAMTISSLTVVLNALRLRRIYKKGEN